MSRMNRLLLLLPLLSTSCVAQINNPHIDSVNTISGDKVFTNNVTVNGLTRLNGDVITAAFVANTGTLSSNLVVGTTISAPVHLAGTDTLATKKDVFQNQWTGKGIVWCGTSIPWLYQPNSYPDIIAKRLGATIYNTAIGGSKIMFDNTGYGMSGTISENTSVHPSFAGHSYENTIMKYLAPPYNAKLVVIDHSFNDVPYLTSCTLGTLSSTDKSTLYGAYDFVIKKILTQYPDVTIVLASCPNRYPGGDSYGISIHESARKAVKDIADKWGLQFLDFGGKMGFNQITSVAGNKTYDGTHQTAEATKSIANVGYKFLLDVN